MKYELKYDGSSTTFDPAEFDRDYGKGRKKTAQRVYDRQIALERKEKERENISPQIRRLEGDPTPVSPLLKKNKTITDEYSHLGKSFVSWYKKLYKTHFLVYSVTFPLSEFFDFSALAGMIWIGLWVWTVISAFVLRGKFPKEKQGLATFFALFFCFPASYVGLMLFPALLPIGIVMAIFT
ncbi:MAG: hypothetical protein R3Y63_06200 [Eubacteriales bacterium]